jgi:hypothetical protein
MKYLEELVFGDFFTYQANQFLLTCDFKLKSQAKYHLVISISDGLSKWFKADTIVEQLDLYYYNEEKHMVALKESHSDIDKNQNIF